MAYVVTIARISSLRWEALKVSGDDSYRVDYVRKKNRTTETTNVVRKAIDSLSRRAIRDARFYFLESIGWKPVNFNKARFYRSIRKSQFLGGIFRNIQDAIPRLVRYSFFNRLSMIARADGHHLWRDARVISRIRSPKISHFRKVNLSCIGRIEKLISLERINDIYIYIE